MIIFLQDCRFQVGRYIFKPAPLESYQKLSWSKPLPKMQNTPFKLSTSLVVFLLTWLTVFAELITTAPAVSHHRPTCVSGCVGDLRPDIVCHLSNHLISPNVHNIIAQNESLQRAGPKKNIIEPGSVWFGMNLKRIIINNIICLFF